jgi:hypothetical protein
VASAARHLEGEDRKVARQLAMEAVIDDGLETAGELLDLLETSGPEQRRAILHRARAGAGLESLEAVEIRKSVEAANQAARLRGSRSSPWQMCGEPTCSEVPVNELGAPVAVDVKRWWWPAACAPCPASRHAAALLGDKDQRERGFGPD